MPLGSWDDLSPNPARKTSVMIRLAILSSVPSRRIYDLGRLHVGVEIPGVVLKMPVQHLAEALNEVV